MDCKDCFYFRGCKKKKGKVFVNGEFTGLIVDRIEVCTDFIQQFRFNLEE